MKRSILIIFSITALLPITSYGQLSSVDYFDRYTVNGLSIHAGFSVGQITNGCKFSNNVLERKFISYGDYSSGNWDWHFKLQYRFKNKYGIEGGFTKSQMDFAFADKAFASKLSDSTYFGGFVFTQNYIAPTLTGYYYFSLPAASEYLLNLYVAGGMNFNFNTHTIFSSPAPFYSNTALQYDPITNQELSFNIHAQSFFIQYYLESGVNFSLYRCNLYLGAKYNFSSAIMTGDYKHFQNGQLFSSEHVSSPSDYFNFTCRVGYILFQHWETSKEKRYKAPKGTKERLKTKYIKPRY